MNVGLGEEVSVSEQFLNGTSAQYRLYSAIQIRSQKERVKFGD